MNIKEHIALLLRIRLTLRLWSKTSSAAQLRIEEINKALEALGYQNSF